MYHFWNFPYVLGGASLQVPTSCRSADAWKTSWRSVMGAHAQPTLRGGFLWFPNSWGYPQIIQVMNDHDFILKPIVTWGFSILRNLHVAKLDSLQTKQFRLKSYSNQ